jgi:hypothetical protein
MAVVLAGCESDEDFRVPMVWRSYAVQIGPKSYDVTVAASLNAHAPDEQRLLLAYSEELHRQGRVIVHNDESGFSFELRDGGVVHRPDGAAVLYDPETDSMLVLARDWPARRCIEDCGFARQYVRELLARQLTTEAGGQ